MQVNSTQLLLLLNLWSRIALLLPTMLHVTPCHHYSSVFTLLLCQKVALVIGFPSSIPLIVTSWAEKSGINLIISGLVGIDHRRFFESFRARMPKLVIISLPKADRHLPLWSTWLAAQLTNASEAIGNWKVCKAKMNWFGLIKKQSSGFLFQQCYFTQTNIP